MSVMCCATWRYDVQSYCCLWNTNNVMLANQLQTFIRSCKEHEFLWANQCWRGGVVVRASYLQPIGRRFKSRPLCFTYNPGQVVHTHVPLFTKQYKLVPDRHKLGAKQALHATLRARGLAAWLRAIETEISTALWLPVAQKRFLLF